VLPCPYSQLSDDLLLALCGWREAGNEPIDCMRGVQHVVMNRVASPGWWGHDIHSVILAPWQFSSFNGGTPDEKRWPQDDDPFWIEALRVAAVVSIKQDADPTHGATSYYADYIRPPSWTLSMIFTVQFGNTRFYRTKTAAEQSQPPVAIDPSLGVD